MTIPLTNYQQGTRRVEEMMWDARQLCYQEQYSYSEGWNDNTFGVVLNLGLNTFYNKITQVDEVANIQEYVQQSVSGQQSYPIPQMVKMAQQIMNVRYLYGTQTWQFVTLEQGMIQDRYSYPTNIPSAYCIRNGQILLSPTPNLSGNNIIINYQARIRKLDYRRGAVTNIISPFGVITNIATIPTNVCQVTTAAPHGLTTGNKVGIVEDDTISVPEVNQQSFIITVTSTTTFTLNGVNSANFPPFSGTGYWFLNPVQWQLNFNIQSQKDVNMQSNANSKLNWIDYVCFVDSKGGSVIDAININGYNQTTFVLTCQNDYVIPYDSFVQFQLTQSQQDLIYVVAGDYTSSHSELDRETEDLLIEWTVLRMLRLQSAAEPTRDQKAAEEEVLERLAIAYRRYRPSVVSIVWQHKLRRKTWGFGGTGAY